MKSFILSQKTIPDLALFSNKIKSIIADFDGFLTEDGIVTVLLTVEVTQELQDQIESIVPPNEPISDVTPRQIRQALILSGVSLASIDAAINTLSEPTRSLAKAEWEYSNSFQRNRPLVAQVGQMLNWTNEQLDNLWIFAATL